MKNRLVTGYAQQGKGNARFILRHLLASLGDKAEIVDGRPGDPGVLRDSEWHAFYGVGPDTLPLWREAQLRRRAIYIDNGYVDSKWYGGSHYRVTMNDLQWSGRAGASPERWKMLNREIAPWRTDGEDILVILQTRPFFDNFCDWGNRSDWLARVLEPLGNHSSRRIVIRDKPVKGVDGPSFADQLERAWCVVTFTSNCAVEAILAGKPAFVTHRCAAWEMAGHDLTKIDEPLRGPGRERWAWGLAENQWSLKEMERGAALRALGIAS